MKTRIEQPAVVGLLKTVRTFNDEVHTAVMGPANAQLTTDDLLATAHALTKEDRIKLADDLQSYVYQLRASAVLMTDSSN